MTQHQSTSNYARPTNIRPRLTTSEFRHPFEFPSLAISVVAGIALTIYFGLITDHAVGALITLVLMLIPIALLAIDHKGYMLEVSDKQFPHIWEMAQDIADKLDMPTPHVYVAQSPMINAYASGVHQTKSVVLFSGLIEAMSERELRTVLSHEFGHLKCEHVITNILNNLTASKYIGLVQFLPLKWLFFFYSRQCEYSADRAALIGSNDLQACITTQLKISVGPQIFEQMDLAAYLDQIQQFNDAPMGKLMELLGTKTHPATVNRIQAFIRYYRSPEYQRIAANHGAAGTTTLTSGDVHTRALLERVSKEVSQEKASSPVHRTTNAAPQETRSNSGESQVINCGTCSTALQPEAKFCHRCGTPVAGASTQILPATELSSQPTQEFPITDKIKKIRRVTRRVSTGKTNLQPAEESGA